MAGGLKVCVISVCYKDVENDITFLCTESLLYTHHYDIIKRINKINGKLIREGFKPQLSEITKVDATLLKLSEMESNNVTRKY